MSVVALVPARGGSVGLPRKNLHAVGGVPLVVRAVECGADAPSVGRVVVSTDDTEIADVARAAGAEVVVRPSALATDTSTSVDVVLDAISQLLIEDDDVVVLLQPTSPLRTSSHVEACVTAFLAHDQARSSISVVTPRHHPLKCLRVDGGFLVPALDGSAFEAPRQSLPEVVEPNGALFVVRAGDVVTYRSFLVPPCIPFGMDGISSLDVDTEDDLRLVESALANRDD